MSTEGEIFHQKKVGKISQGRAVLFVTLIYALVVSTLSGLHEVWRDEVVLIDMIAASKSLFHLFGNLHNYGHPGLWHTLLYFGHSIIPEYFILKITAVSVAVLGVYIFLLRAPFSFGQKLLFVCGFFPIYLYPVFARSYGLSMLLGFAFCALYQDRIKNFIPMSIVLFLLANVHAHTLIIVIAIFLSLAVEFITTIHRRLERIFDQKKIMIGLSIILCGIGLSIIQIIPDQTSIIFKISSLNVYNVTEALIKALVIPGKAFSAVLGFESAIFVNGVIWVLYIYLSRKPGLLIIFAVSVIGLTMFMTLVYSSNAMRHQGALYLLIIMIFWLDAVVQGERISLSAWADKIYRSIASYKHAFFTFLLIMQVCMAYPAVKDDILHDYSSSKRFAAFLDDNKQFKDAILMGEPDTLVESIPYYSDIDIYLHRQKKFGKRVIFTTTKNLDLTLDEYLDTAINLKKETGRPVILMMGRDLNPQGPFIIKGYFGANFIYSKESLKEFHRKVTKITKFKDALGDENYDVYLLK